MKRCLVSSTGLFQAESRSLLSSCIPGSRLSTPCMQIPVHPGEVMQEMQVQVPPGIAPGQGFVVMTPSGEQMQVTCPPGVEPGQSIGISVPAAPVVVQAMPVQAMPVQMSAQSMGVPAMGMAIAPQPLSIGPKDPVPLLDANTAGVLAAVNSFKVQQRVKFWEGITGGCIEQSNTYDFFDKQTGAHLFIAQEVSEDFVRCCCAPMHSLRVEFKMVNAVNRDWKSSGAIAGLPTVFHVEREGCCGKWGLGCFVCAEGCKDGMRVNAGSAGPGQPGSPVFLDSTFAYATQPKCGGWCTPSVNLFHRTGPGNPATLEEALTTGFEPMAKVEGPTIFGGCSELCCNSTFHVSSLGKEQLDTKIQTGDLGAITKTKPRGMCALAREAFTDSDTFDVDYKEGTGLTPQQKAAMMGALVLTDYSKGSQRRLSCMYSFAPFSNAQRSDSRSHSVLRAGPGDVRMHRTRWDQDYSLRVLLLRLHDAGDNNARKERRRWRRSARQPVDAALSTLRVFAEGDGPRAGSFSLLVARWVAEPGGKGTGYGYGVRSSTCVTSDDTVTERIYSVSNVSGGWGVRLFGGLTALRSVRGSASADRS